MTSAASSSPLSGAIVPAPTTIITPSSPLSQVVAPNLPVANHHPFPPSPPSSCGGQSPPPKSPAGPSSPSPLVVQNPIPRVALQKPLFTFSIENILRPDFGNNPRPQRIPFYLPSSESGLRTPPRTPELHKNDSPVDLSKKNPSVQTQGKITPISTEQPPEKPSTENKLTNTFDACNNSNSRIRYPENPEELANPKVPEENMVWPAWVYCTRYSDRPSSGPRSRRIKRRERNPEEKRPRTAFTSEQLAKLKVEFETNKYLDDKRRQTLAKDLNLNESQIKIWFQNKRAKDKKNVGGNKNGLAQHLMAQGLYNHSTMPVDEDDPFLN